MNASPDTYRAIVESAPDAILIVSGGRIEECNASARALLGPQRPLEGSDLASIAPPIQPDGSESAPALLEKARLALAGEPQRFPWQCLRADGSLFRAEVTLSRLGQLGSADGGEARFMASVRDVTGQHQAEEQLRRVFMLSTELLGVVGLDGRFKELSQAWERTLGFTRDELLATPLFTLLHPDDQPKVKAETKRISFGAAFAEFENRFRCKDGSYRWLEWSTTPFLGEGLFYFVARDVTERKRTELALRESKERLRSLLEGLPVFFATMDLTGTVLFVNRGMSGLSREQLAGEHVSRFVPPEQRDALQRTLDEVRRTGRAASLEVLVPQPGGALAWYATQIGPLRRGTELIGMTVVSTDITERKLSELARRESDARFKAAAEGSFDALFVLTSERDEAGRIIDFIFEDMNARGEAMLGLPHEAIVGRGMCEIFPICRESGLFDKYVAVVTAGEATEEELAFGVVSGAMQWVHQQIVPLGDGIAITSRDITERRRLEEQLRESLDRVKGYADELEQKNHLLAEENAERARSEVELRRQKEAIRALSTPIIEAWDGVLALPIIGIVDDARAMQMAERLLGEIVRTRARFAVIDLTGVSGVDTSTVGHLLRITRAAALLGSRCLVSGIRPEVATAMAEIDDDRSFRSFRTLENALRFALWALGVRDVR